MFSGKNVIKPYDQVHLSPEIKDEVNFVNSAPHKILTFSKPTLSSLSPFMFLHFLREKHKPRRLKRDYQNINTHYRERWLMISWCV
jgi:hypothetical protein